MTADHITVRFSTRARNILIGKAALLVLVGVVGGLAMTATDRANVERARTVTLEQYTNEFEQYKAGLVQDVLSPAGNVLGLLGFLFITFAVYEGLGVAIGGVVGRLAGGQNAGTPDSFAGPPGGAA